MFRFPFGCRVTSTKERAKVAFPAVKSEMVILTTSKGTTALKEAIASVIKWYKKYGFITSNRRFDSEAMEKGYELIEVLTEQEID